MNRDDIIRTAREAGFTQGDLADFSDLIVHFAALVAAAERERLAQEPVATPSRSFEDVYKVQTERLATERERADKAEQNYRLMIKNHVPRNIFDWNTRKSLIHNGTLAVFGSVFQLSKTGERFPEVRVGRGLPLVPHRN